MIALGVIMGILSVLAIGFLIFSIWLNSSYFVVTVDGGSMNDTLHSEDRLYASYSAKAKRGDIVIIDATEHPAFKTSDGSERLLIKRLIAVEGDSIKCEDGIVYLKKAGEQTYQKLEEPSSIRRREISKRFQSAQERFFFSAIIAQTAKTRGKQAV